MGLSIGLELCFLAVGAFSKVLMGSNKANTAVDATTVMYRLKSRKKLNMLLDHFQAVLIQVWESLGKPIESMI